MNEQEYIRNVCKKCKYKYDDKDICEIMHTINGKCKCVNFIKIGLWKRIKRYIKRLFRSENGTSIFRKK